MRVPRNTPHIHVRTFQFFLEQTDSLQAAGALGDGGEAVEQVEVLDEHVVAVRYQVGPVGTRSAAVGRGRELEVGGAIGGGRSAERRVGKACVSRCRARW